MTMIWVERLISLAVLLQTVEFFKIPGWPWSVVKNEIPKILWPFAKSYKVLLWIRWMAAALCLYQPFSWGLLIQLLTTWMLAVRWRGTFNGGSDTMTVQVLGASFISSMFHGDEKIDIICILFISLQVMLSYFIAGMAKLAKARWRDGTNLAYFMNTKKSPFTLLLSWGLMGFECLFPLASLSSWTCFAFLFLGFFFHLANFYYFGLNRFVWVWMATYPALFFLSTHLH